MNQNKSAKILRYAILTVILVFVSYQVFSHALSSKLYPAVHGICPFGGLESLYLYVTQKGATLGKVFSGTLGLFFITVIITLIFRRSFCGMICPLGTIQEFAGNFGKLIFKKKKFLIPAVIDKPLRYLKYLMLILTIAMAWITNTLWFQIIDPWTAYAHILSFKELTGLYLIGFIVLIITIIMSFFFERFFCKYACPMGAFNALAGFFSRFKIFRDKDICINCNLCSKECPVQIDVAKKETVNSLECINCEKCVHVCPEKDAIKTRFFGFSIKPVYTLLTVIFIYFSGLTLFQFYGYDRFSGKTEATLRELAKIEGLSSVEFKEKLGLPEGMSNSTKLRKIEYNIPLYKIAELNKTTVEDLKAGLELPQEINKETLWGDAYGEVKLSIIAKLNNTTVENYFSYFKLGEKVNSDTRWKDVRDTVGKILDEQNAKSGCGEH